MNKEICMCKRQEFFVLILTTSIVMIISGIESDIIIELSLLALTGYSLMVMIKLKLTKTLSNFESVRNFPGLSDLKLDEKFGLIPVDFKNSLYVVRVDEIDDLDRRRKLSPEIIDIYGDVRISTT